MNVKTIDIIGKEWTDRVNGNSYCSATVTADYGTPSAKVLYVPFQYGYGDHYVQLGLEAAIAAGWCNATSITDLRLNGVILRRHIQRGCRQSAVKAWGTSP
jgi:hypothetical protein